MIIIIPIGGVGRRFKDNGYTKPKALIHIFDKPILFYLIDNLNLDNIEYIYIPYNKEYKLYNFEELLIKKYPHIYFKFSCLQNNTRGAAETINIALNNLIEDDNKPILCLDCDSFYLCDIVSKWNGDNCIFTFKDVNKKAIYSYIECDNKNNIINIKEKEKISDFACSGGYGFDSIQTLKKYTTKIIEKNIMQKNEFYTSGVIKEMIKDRYKFQKKEIDRELFVTLGIPNDIENYYINIINKCINKNNKLLLNINGHSNFNINIIIVDNKYYLCKNSTNYEDALRLNKQIEKQEIQQKLFNLKIPKIYFKSQILENKNYFLMEFMNNCKDCFTYITNNNFLVLEKLFIFFKNIIEKYISNSISKKIDKNTLINKISSIKININKLKHTNFLTEPEYNIIDRYLKYLENKSSDIINVKLPIGFCHGDLTLSNMLFDELNNELYLIDFLDSFIETPLFDIIKLRQDTKFFWSINMCNLNIDTSKIKIGMHHLDKKIDNYFKKYSFYNLCYNYFEIVNLLRVLQYCKSEKIKKYLFNCLDICNYNLDI